MKGEENVSGSDKSVKQYAAEVFNECLVSGVPNIVNARSWKVKLFKALVLGLCICGFLYQASEFVAVVLTYPSVVDINVYTPTKFVHPAITMCNNNGIRRSKFCEQYPDSCETPNNRTEFCSKYPHYCDDSMDWEHFKVPKPEFYDFEKYITLRDLKTLGHDSKTLITYPDADDDLRDNNDTEGPIVFFKNFETAFSCYSLHLRVDSELDPHMLHFEPLAGFPLLDIEFNFELNETFLPGREPGGLFVIHSPYQLVNPYDNGVFLQPGKIYKIHLKLTEEELLPYPYPSGCANYTQNWLNRGRKGPRSQEMCKQTCINDILIQKCNCSIKFLNVLHKEDSCFLHFGNLKCIEDETEKLDHCVEALCKEDCQKYKFQYEVQERNIEEIDWESSSDSDQKRSHVQIYATDPEVVVYKYRPHYQNIEVFSYIGGYIGAWLGISLVAVADFFECLFRIAVFAFKRRKQEKSKKDIALSSM